MTLSNDNYIPPIFQDDHQLPDAVNPDPVALEIKHYLSELNIQADEIMQHDWVQDKVNDGWQITHEHIRKALVFQLETMVEAMVKYWSADDLMHGQLGTELQHEILEQADK